MASDPRIYISVLDEAHLTPDQAALKRAILEAVRKQGFDLQIFHEAGTPANQGWNFSNANSLMSHCHGAVILAFAKWHHANLANGITADLPSEFNHFEGGLAVAHDVPTLLITDPTVRTGGITYEGGGRRIYFWPSDRGADWVNSDNFGQYLSEWASAVRARRKVFLGYCSAAKTTADALTNYVEQTDNTEVVNYVTDFRPGRTILEEIEAAEKQCAVGVFLFTNDDQFVGTETYAAPRDNVVFEAGYFTRAKGKDRVLIIREEGAKMLADLGGVIYLPLKDRTDIGSVKAQIRRFLDDNL